MSAEKKYDYMEHTADARFRAYGANLEEAFENAAEAMFNVMIDTSDIPCRTSIPIEVEADDLEMLLVEWLSELLYHFEVEFIVFSKFAVIGINHQDGVYSLSATACGEFIDLDKHAFETEVKAVTYNNLLVQEAGDDTMVQVTVDT
ncbi:SHS2 domain-containing protein [Methanohalophilus levihalophilus]|uniref:archease n=1 Tax=Methanohalophilus levihalophilus TaxID=1431282 RepID=UPI001AE3659E|nr:archease [Methanohalophilus levihalophilus]MBP2030383.1 SHS2 domain-containing protein [Methanohalophilus levihalophilus]